MQRLDAIDKAQGVGRSTPAAPRPTAPNRNPAQAEQRARAQGHNNACDASQQRIQEENQRAEDAAELLRFAAQFGAELRALLLKFDPDALTAAQAVSATNQVVEGSQQVSSIVKSYRAARAAFKQKAKRIIFDLVKKAAQSPATKKFANQIPFAGDIIAGALVLVEEYLLTGDLDSSIKLATAYITASAAAGYTAGLAVGAATGAAIVTAPAAPVTAAIADALASAIAGEQLLKQYRENNPARAALIAANRKEAEEDGVVVVRAGNPTPATSGSRTIVPASSPKTGKIDARTAGATATRANQDKRSETTNQNVGRGTDVYRYPIK